jgi:CDP-diacylglycerol--glycerol-3-phosphate 3-phosphatidyltransferase
MLRGGGRQIPLALTGLRAALGPVIVLLALHAPVRWALGLCLVLAIASDLFDGVIARQLGIATPTLRRLDSVSDTIFYVGAAFAAWHLHPAAITGRLVPLGVLAVLEIGRYLLDWARFRQEASYHMWSSKAWGVVLFLGLFSLLALGTDNGFVSAAIYLGILADVEGVAISLVLKHPRTDVPTLWHAVQLRKKP